MNDNGSNRIRISPPIKDKNYSTFFYSVTAHNGMTRAYGLAVQVDNKQIECDVDITNNRDVDMNGCQTILIKNQRYAQNVKVLIGILLEEIKRKKRHKHSQLIVKL